MSDLTATNCGCDGNNGCNTIIWLIILLSLCGGCGNGTSLFNGNGCGDSCCWIILLLLFCGGCGNGTSLFSGNGNGCGCGC